MRSYPIWNVINSCIYSNYNKGSGNKSYGVKKHSTIDMYVGTSKQNSYHLAEITQKVSTNQHGNKVFTLYVDGKCIVEGILNNNTKEYKKVTK